MKNGTNVPHGADPISAALAAVLGPLVRAAVVDALEAAEIGKSSAPEPLLDTTALSKYLNVSTRTVQTLREQGLPSRRVGDSWRYDRSEIDSWTREQAKRGE